MRILTRGQFKHQITVSTKVLSDDHSPLWAYELHSGLHSEWFICIGPVRDCTYGEAYKEWNNTNMKGDAICYLSNDIEEWWGFTVIDDVLLWVLRWA